MRLQCKDAACGCSVQLQHVVAVMRLECKVAACGCSVQLQRVVVQHGCPPEEGGAMQLSLGQQLCSSPGGGALNAKKCKPVPANRRSAPGGPKVESLLDELRPKPHES